jgi:hypothetical protein
MKVGIVCDLFSVLFGREFFGCSFWEAIKTELLIQVAICDSKFKAAFFSAHKKIIHRKLVLWPTFVPSSAGWLSFLLTLEQIQISISRFWGAIFGSLWKLCLSASVLVKALLSELLGWSTPEGLGVAAAILNVFGCI